jgi:RNA recognition motif-containing protein
LKNPNYVVNTKRLTVKNVPKHFENGDLMKAIANAMKLTGPSKLKRCGVLKVAIVKDKVPVVDADSSQHKKPQEWSLEMDESEDEKDVEMNKGNEKIKMKKKSRGFAFVDFNSTENALRCLNAMNNVVGAFGDGTGTRRPIVEFSFDDVRKLQIQKARLEKMGGVRDTPVKVIKKGKRLGRGQKQRLKRRLAKQPPAQQ